MEGYREAMDGGVEGPSHAPNAVSSVGGVMQPLYACPRRDLNEMRTPYDIACWQPVIRRWESGNYRVARAMH